MRPASPPFRCRLPAAAHPWSTSAGARHVGSAFRPRLGRPGPTDDIGGACGSLQCVAPARFGSVATSATHFSAAASVRLDLCRNSPSPQHANRTCDPVRGFAGATSLPVRQAAGELPRSDLLPGLDPASSFLARWTRRHRSIRVRDRTVLRPPRCRTLASPLRLETSSSIPPMPATADGCEAPRSIEAPRLRPRTL